MLIVFEIKTELPIVMLFIRLFEWFKQFSDVIHGKQRTAQYSHDLHDWTTDLHVMFDDTNEAICDDGNMYLNTNGILGLSPKGLDAKMLLDPPEEQLDLPPVSIKECNVCGFKVEVVCIVCEGTPKLWRVVNDASDRCRIIRFVSLASEADSLVTKNVIVPFLKVITALNLIGRMKFFPNNEECSGTMDFIESCEVKIPSVKHIACISVKSSTPTRHTL